MTKSVKLPDEETLSQLSALGYNGSSHVSDRPLLVCDVDEVVLHLVDPFEKVLNERGFELRAHSFQLTGNIFHLETGVEASQAEVWGGLDQLFEEQHARQHVVDGVVEALNELQQELDIVFLTNLPHAYGDVRRTYLRNLGLPQPLVTNSASKAPALGILASGHSAAVGFIDDSPTNIQQVGNAWPDIRLFHFIANERFRALMEPLEGPLYHGSLWSETWPVIAQHLRAKPAD